MATVVVAKGDRLTQTVLVLLLTSEASRPSIRPAKVSEQHPSNLLPCSSRGAGQDAHSDGGYLTT